MAVQSRAGMAQVVTGLIQPEELGVTLTHEHLMSDAAVLVPPPPQASLRDMHFRPVAMETFAYAKHYSDVIHNFEDFVLRDVDTAIDELMIYRQFGGDSMVECSSIGLGRDPVALARISRATGVNIVMGASYYVAKSHPPDMDDIGEEEITEQIVRDVTEGVDGTHIRSGVIGEVGCTYPLPPNERKVLRASGRAQKIGRSAADTPRPGRHRPAAQSRGSRRGGRRPVQRDNGPPGQDIRRLRRVQARGGGRMLRRVGSDRRGALLL